MSTMGATILQTELIRRLGPAICDASEGKREVRTRGLAANGID